jgi:DNA-binding GntR family transcriptional regulator
MLGKMRPGEKLARIILARRGHVRMADDIAARDAVAVDDLARELDDRFHLCLGKGSVSEFMAGIDDFHTDARTVHIGDASPIRAPCMPGALVFIDHADHLTILCHQIMRGNLCFRVCQPGQRRGGVPASPV